MLETIRCDDYVNLMAVHSKRDHTDRGQTQILSEQISNPSGFRANYLGYVCQVRYRCSNPNHLMLIYPSTFFKL
jgi:hypothetical protein